MTRFASLSASRASFWSLCALGLALSACGDSGTDTTTTTSGNGGAGGDGTSASGGGATGGEGTGGATTSAGGGATGGEGTGGEGGGVSDCGTPTECAAQWEENASSYYDDLFLGDRDGLAMFLANVPKGGDLHNHMTGAVYAETYLGWAKMDGDCINSSTFAAVSSGQCSATNLATPASGPFFDSIVRAWSMKDFMPGAETSHDHFFATFGKVGLVAGAHRNQELADLATRAASENQLYVETMFNMGKNIGQLSTDIWSGTLSASDLPGLYASIKAAPTFASELAKDVATVDQAYSQYRGVLGCSGANPPPACAVDVRFVSQVARTGAKDLVFGQLISAFEVAAKSPHLVAANLSSPEDDSTSINNYMLHMAMLDFLHQKYATTNLSPLHITLHAGELTPDVLPPGSTANTFHIREAVELGHAERIGHGIDILSESDPIGLMDEMRQQGVLVEVCMSSNAQILNVSGNSHPLATYMDNQVPVALATDDQGVSRSSLAGEYLRAATDQGLSYKQLKTMARDSLEHAFLPGTTLWISVSAATPVTPCEPTDTMGVGTTPNATCQAFLDGSEKARAQWDLERRFRIFESQL